LFLFWHSVTEFKFSVVKISRLVRCLPSVAPAQGGIQRLRNLQQNNKDRLPGVMRMLRRLMRVSSTPNIFIANETDIEETRLLRSIK